MAGKNQVTLTFAGDSEKLEKSFKSVGAAAGSMSDDVGRASRDVGDSVDNTGQKAGDLESGFRGVTDSMSGFSQIAQGDVLGGMTDLAGGVEALATGFSGVFIPALQKGVGWLKATRVGTLGVAAAQRVLNLAMRANPIGIVITVLALLAGALVAAWKKSETFRAIVMGTWNAIKSGAQAMGRVVASVARAIAAPFRAAFNGIRQAWNATIGGKGFSVPSWVPGIGGREFRIPRLHSGGVVPGPPGSETLALLQAGERVTPAGRSSGIVIEINSSGAKVDDWLLEILRKSVRVRGGNVQLVLGR